MKCLGAVLLALTVTTAAAAPIPSASYAQYLVTRTLARHPEAAGLTLRVTPPNTKGSVVVASNVVALGTKADATDLRVLETRQPAIEISKAGDRLQIKLPLLDASRRPVGTIDVLFPFNRGSDKQALQANAQKVRDELARRISHVANLTEPASYDARVAADNYGQKLVDDVLAAHPEIEILALHATIPKTDDNVIVASNIGRIGKKADEDDMRVIRTEQPNLEINSEGNRFEAELVLRDVSGSNVGAVGVVYGYKAGDDKAAFQREAEKIRATLGRHITNAGNLFEPYPYVANAPAAPGAERLVAATLRKHPELLILAMHVKPPGATDAVIVASNIGRVGKKADEDDMSVINTGKPILEVNEAGNRFEVELVLLDSAGNNIGAVSTVFAYRAGADRERLHHAGERIRDELRGQIATLGSLFEPAARH